MYKKFDHKNMQHYKQVNMKNPPKFSIQLTVYEFIDYLQNDKILLEHGRDKHIQKNRPKF